LEVMNDARLQPLSIVPEQPLDNPDGDAQSSNSVSSAESSVAEGNPKALYVSALKSLCDETTGGYTKVARRAGVSAANLVHIIKGRKLPSGEAVGVGPNLAKAISTAFPGWPLNYLPVPLAAGEGQACLARAVSTLASAVATRSRIERKQLAVLLALLATDPDERSEVCNAILTILEANESESRSEP